MGVGNRPAACASCGKRLNYKQWYYRNGKHYCKKRCWVTDREKAAQEPGTSKQDSGPTKVEAPKATAAKE